VLNPSADRLGTVLDFAQQFLERAACTPASAQLLAEALADFERRAQPTDSYFPPSAHLPLLVFESLTGDWRKAVPLAAATTLVFIGVDVLDDLMDGDVSVHWPGRPTAEILLGGATLITAAPQLILADIEATASVRARLQRLLAQGMLEMSGGQLADIQNTGRPFVSLGQVMDSVEAKSGAMLATFAEMAVVLAGAKQSAHPEFKEIGRLVGVASQLRSDCRDLFGAPRSRDLQNGTRTAPIVMRMEQLEQSGRAAFLKRLQRASHDDCALTELRQELIESNILGDVATLIELYCQTAHQLLDEGTASNNGRIGLRNMINELSMLDKQQ